MKFKKNFNICFFFLLLFQPIFCFSQEKRPVIEIGANQIKLNDLFFVSITIKDNENRPNCVFPELNGFKKRTNSYSKIPVIINGKATFDQKFTQEYLPSKVGNFIFSSGKIQVDGDVVIIPNFTVNVAASELENTEENFKDFIDGSAYEFVDVKDDAFFAITVNKLKPYVGEGILVTLAFYIAQNNKAELNFINENAQLDDIMQKIRPKNCWEENLRISEIKAKMINIGSNKYFQYKIAQSIYYPLNNQPINIPTQRWQMLKYKIAKDQEVSKSKKEDFKTYFSKPISIRPILLPKSSLVSTDNVGDFEIEEFIEKEIVQTGRSFKYTINIKGNGSIRNIKFPEMLSDSLFEIYEPSINLTKSYNLGKLIEEKSFNFDIVPKFAGNFSLKNYFSIDYFNTRTQKYEVLKAQKSIEVVGSDIANDEKPISTENDLFENLGASNSEESSIEFRELIIKLSNFLIVSMLIAMVYIFWPNKK